MTRKILLLGPQGQVGWELQRALQPPGEVINCDRHQGGDLTQPVALQETVRTMRPDLIVNAAAHTAVDRAETEPELAEAINAVAPGLLAREAQACGALLIHYSTDYVFDGSGTHARDESTPTGPLSVYGRTKLAGEDAIRASGCHHLIFRTSWVYGARGGNFAKTMLRLAKERPQLTVIDDQIGAPTGADLLADLSAHAALRTLSQPQLAGTYHVVAGGFTSWHGYARHVIARAMEQGQALQAGPHAVQAIPTRAYPTPARRPLNSRLDTRRFQAAFGLSLPDWRIGVNRLLDELVS
jgi:dTDP-4-dehydrorhamnose reductase